MSKAVKTIAPSEGRVRYGSKDLQKEPQGLFSKIGNDLAADLVRYRRSDMVLGCADMPSGSNLGQIEIDVRCVASGCVGRGSAAAGEFFRSVVNPVLAAA